MEGGVGVKDGFASPAFHGFSEDGIAVIVVEDHDIVVAIGGWGDEAASLVSVDLTSGLEGRGVEVVGAFALEGGGREAVISVGFMWRWGLGGALVAATLVKVTLDHRD
jgi:hypothetical protein